MARAHGFRGQLLFAFESTYGTAPATGAYFRLPFISADLGGEQALEEDDTLGLGRDPQAPTYDVLRVGGSIVVPLDLRNIGFWLKLGLGAPTTVGASAPYTHTFASGGLSLLSAAIEIGYPEVPAYFLCKGCVLGSMQFTVNRQGKPQVTLQLQGQDQAKATTSVDGTPNEKVLTRFSKFEGKIQRNASDLANLVSGDLTYDNGIEAVDTVRADELVEGIDPGMAKLSGNLTARFAATTLYDDAQAKSAVDLDYVFTRDADNKLTLAAQSVYLPKAKNQVSGPGGIEASYAWQGAKDAVEGEMLEVVLINDVADYNNAV